MARTRRLAAIIALFALGVYATSVGATDLTLTFGSLPSAQGWVFATGGSPLATESVFSVSGGVLSYNTMSFATTGVGTAAYYQ